jgi:hypothetical protein
MRFDSMAPERASVGVSVPLGQHFLKAALE